MKPYHTWSGEERAAFYAALVKRINNPDYFSSRIGVRITEIQEGEAWGELLDHRLGYFGLSAPRTDRETDLVPRKGTEDGAHADGSSGIHHRGVRSGSGYGIIHLLHYGSAELEWGDHCRLKRCSRDGEQKKEAVSFETASF